MSRHTFRFLLGVGSLAAAHVHRHPLPLYRAWLLVIGVYLCIHALLRLTYYRAGTPWPDRRATPRPLRLRWFDPFLALVAWLDAFRRTYAVPPGLYHTGPTNDPEAPLLVTANHRLTVLALVRHLRRHPTRILVVDTDGINVWCSAAKGVFSAEAILTQLARYGMG